MHHAAEILDRLPPSDLSAEMAVIGSVLLNRDVLTDAEWLRPDEFYADAHQVLWRNLLAMEAEDEPTDPVSLRSRLRAAGQLEAVGGEAYLMEVIRSVGAPSSIGYYAAIVRKMASYRRLIQVGTEMLRSGYAMEGEPEKTMDRAESQLAGIGDEASRGPMTAMQAASEFTAMVDRVMESRQGTGLMTGLYDFDVQFGGLFPSELTILAARPSVGKSALGTQIAYHAASRGKVVYFATLEMRGVEVASRCICSLAEVDSRELRIGKLCEGSPARLADASNEFSKAKLWISDQSGQTVNAIRRGARRLKKHELALIIVDYLQLVKPTDARSPRLEQVRGISEGLKNLAKEMEVPVLCLCQLNRESEKEGRPRLRHLRESGSIEQDADSVWLLHREWSGADKAETLDTRTELFVEKNRNAPTGTLKLTWIPSRVRFDCGWTETQDAWHQQPRQQSNGRSCRRTKQDAPSHRAFSELGNDQPEY